MIPRPSSVEAQVDRALGRLVFFRLLGDVFSLPRILLQSLSHWVGMVEKTCFYLELDAARRYRAATNVDLGVAVGEDVRYAGLDPHSAESRDRKWADAREDSE